MGKVKLTDSRPWVTILYRDMSNNLQVNMKAVTFKARSCQVAGKLLRKALDQVRILHYEYGTGGRGLDDIRTKIDGLECYEWKEITDTELADSFENTNFGADQDNLGGLVKRALIKCLDDYPSGSTLTDIMIKMDLIEYSDPSKNYPYHLTKRGVRVLMQLATLEELK